MHNITIHKDGDNRFSSPPSSERRRPTITEIERFKWYPCGRGYWVCLNPREWLPLEPIQLKININEASLNVVCEGTEKEKPLEVVQEVLQGKGKQGVNWIRDQLKKRQRKAMDFLVPGFFTSYSYIYPWKKKKTLEEPCLPMLFISRRVPWRNVKKRQKSSLSSQQILDKMKSPVK